MRSFQQFVECTPPSQWAAGEEPGAAPPWIKTGLQTPPLQASAGLRRQIPAITPQTPCLSQATHGLKRASYSAERATGLSQLAAVPSQLAAVPVPELAAEEIPMPVPELGGSSVLGCRVGVPVPVPKSRVLAVQNAKAGTTVPVPILASQCLSQC